MTFSQEHSQHSHLYSWLVSFSHTCANISYPIDWPFSISHAEMNTYRTASRNGFGYALLYHQCRQSFDACTFILCAAHLHQVTSTNNNDETKPSQIQRPVSDSVQYHIVHAIFYAYKALRKTEWKRTFIVGELFRCGQHKFRVRSWFCFSTTNAQVVIVNVSTGSEDSALKNKKKTTTGVGSHQFLLGEAFRK